MRLVLSSQKESAVSQRQVQGKGVVKPPYFDRDKQASQATLPVQSKKVNTSLASRQAIAGFSPAVWMQSTASSLSVRVLYSPGGLVPAQKASVRGPTCAESTDQMEALVLRPEGRLCARFAASIHGGQTYTSGQAPLVNR